jgi:hypothetical protein
MVFFGSILLFVVAVVVAIFFPSQVDIQLSCVWLKEIVKF